MHHMAGAPSASADALRLMVMFDGNFQELFEVVLGQDRHDPSRAVQLLVQRGQDVHGKLGLLLNEYGFSMCN